MSDKKNEIFEQSQSAKKYKRGPFGIFNILPAAKYQKTLRGDPLETLKNFREK